MRAIVDSYALLADGTAVEIRPATPADFDAVKAMHAAMSPDNSYLRFFSLSRLSAEHEAQRICQAKPGRMALLALADGQVAGCGSYDTEPGGTAEIAFAVADHLHHRGIATLLLEHLVSSARREGITAFTAQTLGENTAMLHVFADAGLPVRQRYCDGVAEVMIPLPCDETGTTLDAYLETVARRERAANAASLRHVLAPRSVVVIGASQRTGTQGRAILDNIRTYGYAGRLYAVTRHARQLGGVPCVPAVANLSEPPDLAVIAVPAAGVPGIAEDCGQLGVKAVVVLTAGLDTPARTGLLAICRRHGMRLIGPDSAGIAVPGAGLDATFAASHPAPGTAGLLTQSGGLGLALAGQLSRLGIGISSFVSAGDKLDVSGNDMLLWWEQDEVTKLAVLYIESFGNPRKFARTARRVSARMPVLTVYCGRDERTSALFDQAGIITAPGLGELIETTALLAVQPAPAGRRIAIVSNVGSAATLAADACTSLGLTVHHPDGMTRRKLRTLIPGSGTVTGPVDTTAAVSGEDFRRCLELVAADEHADAIVAIVLPTGASGDLAAAIQQATVGVPVTAVVLSQPESVRLLGGTIPAYAYPEAALAALARAASYGAWRTEPRGQVPGFPGVRAADARAIVGKSLHGNTGGGWLPAGDTADLLRCYGIPLADLNPAAGQDADTQPAADAGTELTIGVAVDDTFGPLVMLGSGAVAGDLLASHSARLAPLTDTDADTLIRSVRLTPLINGSTNLTALRDVLLRVSRATEDLPEITDLDLSPVIAHANAVSVTGARIRVAPCQPQDPFLRKLR